MRINSVGFLNSQMDMAKVVKIIVEYCADVKPGENVVIASDDAQSRNVYISLTVAGADASLLPYPTPGTDIVGNRVSMPGALRPSLRDAKLLFPVV